MIAIVVLGIGMVMAAAVFPVALTQTRESIEMSVGAAAADVAVETAKLVAMASYDRGGNPGLDWTAADLEWADDVPNPEMLVHVLRAWNLAYSGGTVIPVREYPEHLFAMSGAQFYPPNLLSVPPFPDQGLTPEVSIEDRVYPPIDAKRDVGSGPGGIIGRRRYCWTILHRRIQPGAASGAPNDKRTFLLSIAVTRRSDLNARFAAQSSGPGANLLQPAPSSQSGTPSDPPDTLFPQAWLVQFNQNLNYQQGVATCTWQVGRLLPAGATFVDFATGQPHKVLSQTTSDPDGNPRTGDETITLTLERGRAAALPQNLAWVFPPPVERALSPGQPVQFVGPCPVIGVYLREVTLP